MKTLFAIFCLGAAVSGLGASEPWTFESAPDPVYQWSVAVSNAVSRETGKPSRAYLWIPPDCRHVNGVVIGQHNMLEEPLLAHPLFRAELAKAGLAAVWVTPILCGQTNFVAAAQSLVSGMLMQLADESGYSELTTAPVAVIGHSAMADWPYYVAAAWPDRTLCAISVKGSWADMKRQCANDLGQTMAHVPFLLLDGEYEDADGRAGRSLGFRHAYPQIPFSMTAEAGAGHFGWSDSLARYLGTYIRKAAEYRLDASGRASVLRPIDPTREGWLMERWHVNKAPSAVPAAVAVFKGDRDQAYWYFDKEMADLTTALQEPVWKDGKVPLLGYVQDGAVLPQNPKEHLQVIIPFKPLAEGDGTLFRLTPCYLENVPPGRPVGWSGLPEGSVIGHPADTSRLVIHKISGPFKRIGKDLFAIRFDRIGFEGYRARELVFVEEAPGGNGYRRMVQQALMRIPFPNREGAAQTITFPAVGPLRPGARNVQLKATSSAGAKVRYYVREGPAVVDDAGRLSLTAIPPRAKLPVKVTVCAWQWGCSTVPKLQSAEPVYQTILVR